MSASFLFMFSFLVLLRPNSRFQSSDLTSMFSNHVMLSDIVQRPGMDRKSGGRTDHWRYLPRIKMLGSVCFGSCANLLDESSAAQRLDRSLKGRLQFPLALIYFAAVAKAMETMQQGVVNNITKSCSDRASLWI
jgi:hypothetical protein